MIRSIVLALFVVFFAACDASPPPVNELVENTPGAAAQEWLQKVFYGENPNVAEYRFVSVNSQQILNDADSIRLTLLDGDIVTATKRSSDVYDGSILWTGEVEGVSKSDVRIRVTNNPYMAGHVVIDDKVELFAQAAPHADSIVYRVDTPVLTYSREADILPDADPSMVEGVAWKALVDKLPASTYRIVTLEADVWRRKMTELSETGSTEMRFFDDTPFRVVINEHGGYPTIDGDVMSSVSLNYIGGNAGLHGGVKSRRTGTIRVTPIEKTGHYAVWLMHPNAYKKID